MAKKKSSGKKNSIESKMKTYSALAAGLVALAGNADAQILYTDINPDTLIGLNSSYLLDLNKDGKPDFRLSQVNKATSASNNYYNNIEVTPMDTNNRVLNTSSEQPYPVAIPLNASIGPNAEFWDKYGIYGRTLNSSYEMNNQQYNVGNWRGAKDKYLGLYVQIEGKKYYGWARLDVPELAKSFVVKDYAINTVGDEKISAGQTGTIGVLENDLKLNTVIYTYYNDLYINLNNTEKLDGKIELFSTNGQLVKTVKINESENQFILENISSGIYVLSIKTNQGNLNKKVMIE